MSSDLELLELAAKAAGLPWDQWVIDGNDAWNPLTDDGDALRLAVKLRLAIDHNYPQDQNLYVCVSRVGCEMMYPPVSELEELDDEWQRADATRRAVVRAAAAIGEAMP